MGTPFKKWTLAVHYTIDLNNQLKMQGQRPVYGSYDTRQRSSDHLVTEKIPIAWSLFSFTKINVIYDIDQRRRHIEQHRSYDMSKSLLARGRTQLLGFFETFPAESSMPVFKKIGW